MVKRLLAYTFMFLSIMAIQAQNVASPEEPGILVTAAKKPGREELVAFAKQYLGTPYRRGSYDPNRGFDCSGFVYYVFNKFDVLLPRSSKEYKFLGKALQPEEFKVGDVLVFYGYKDISRIGHVGIICEANGMKSRFIHSSSGKAYGVIISDLDSKGYKKRFYKCIDVLE